MTCSGIASCPERGTVDDAVRPNYSIIIKDNEKALAEALAEGSFLQAYLLVHALIEALLRLFLRIPEDKDLSFAKLVETYRYYLEREHYPYATFIDELTKFNQRRNRIVHQLWRKGHSFTNRQTEPAARAAIMMYGLFIEWLETFDSEITQIGFRYDESIDDGV